MPSDAAGAQCMTDEGKWKLGDWSFNREKFMEVHFRESYTPRA